jgi:hypothetical protein
MGDGLEQHVIGMLVATLSTAMAVVSMGDVLRCRRNKSLGKVGHAPPEWAAVGPSQGILDVLSDLVVFLRTCCFTHAPHAGSAEFLLHCSFFKKKAILEDKFQCPPVAEARTN